MFDKHLKGSVIRLCPGVVLTEKAWDEDYKERVRVPCARSSVFLVANDCERAIGERLSCGRVPGKGRGE